MEIAEWLRGLGLGQYAPAFAENAIHWDVLPKLTADDLKEIGVAAVGDRRRLLEAITSLGGRALPAASASVPSAVFAEAERRQLTVMFCDLVGSTPLSVRFDPEDLREIVGAYHRCVAETTGRFAGFVAKYMGDGVLVYFGYPEAHEDDAERAVLAGLALIDAVGADRAQIPLTAGRETMGRHRLSAKQCAAVIEARRANPQATQAEIARAAGVSRPSVSRIEGGRRGHRSFSARSPN